MPEMRFSFDGNPVQNPKDWAMSEEVIRRVKEFGTMGLVKEWKLPATFSGTGYTYLHDLFHASGVCVVVDVLIEYRCTALDAWQDLFIGKLFINDCKFNLSKCEVITQIEDNSVTAKLINNQSIKVRLNGDTSKNGVSITPATAFTFDMFTPSTGVYDHTCTAYRIYDVLTYLVAFLSDDEVDFDSDLFDNAGGDYGVYWLTTGRAIRTEGPTNSSDQNIYPYISLKEVLENLNKKFNTAFWVDNSGATPVFRLEKRSDSFDATNTLTINNVPNITERFKTEEMYSSVTIGSETTIEDDCTLTFASSPFISFQEEDYAVLGECNIDSTLDLKNTWIIDSNIIEDILVNANDEYDKKTFLVRGLLATAQAGRSATPTGAAFYYNQLLQNDWVLPRHLGSVPNAIIQFLGYDDLNVNIDSIGGGVFPPGTNQQYSPWLNQETSDPGNAWRIQAFSNYEARLTGSYTLQFNMSVTIFTVGEGGGDQVRIRAIHFDKCGNTITTYTRPVIGLPATATGASDTISIGPIMCNAGDYIVPYMDVAANGPAISLFFNTNFGIHNFLVTDSPSKDYDGYDPDDYKVILYDFEFPMSFSNWELIRAAITESITINPGTDPANNIKGNIQELTYNLGRGVVKGTLIKSVN